MDSINIKKLAKELNLSTSTISRAFRGSSDINKETKERVLSLAYELNYEPNHHASNLREQKSSTIAVIVPEIANNFFSQAINGIEKIAREKKYHILIYLTDDDFEKEITFINNLHSGRVDGIIMSVSGEAHNHDYLNKLKKKKIPLVFFDRVYEDIDTAKVTSNDYESSFSATEHLIKSGCKRIAYLVVNKSFSIGKMRMRGYIDALAAFNIPYQDDLIIDCSNELDKNQEILTQVFKELKPDGVFASVERLAIATYKVCYKEGIKIPEDIKIISFSSLEIASLLNPSLSTITQPAFEMGTEAANLLFKAIKPVDDQNVNDQVVCKSEIIVRRSSATL
jgi:LacI family transcriptional regulator